MTQLSPTPHRHLLPPPQHCPQHSGESSMLFSAPLVPHVSTTSTLTAILTSLPSTDLPDLGLNTTFSGDILWTLILCSTPKSRWASALFLLSIYPRFPLYLVERGLLNGWLLPDTIMFTTTGSCSALLMSIPSAAIQQHEGAQQTLGRWNAGLTSIPACLRPYEAKSQK